jgi:PAS domain S-box-containing protein
MPVFTKHLGADSVYADADPNTTAPEEAIRRDMADTLLAIVYSGVPTEGESLPHLDFANRYAEEYFGIAEEALAGARWIELVHPVDRAGVRAAWAASLATGQHYRHEHRLKLADGTYRRFLTQALPLRDEDRAIVKWYGVATPLDGEPRRRGPRQARVDCYPLRDADGLIHLLEMVIWQDRPDDPAAKHHPSGVWYRAEFVAEAVWRARDQA